MAKHLAELAEKSHERLGERMVMDFDGKKFTNTQLLVQAQRFQNAFEKMGLGKGEIAVLYMANAPLIYPVFQGIFRSGAAAVPVMFQLTAPEAQYIISDTKAKGVVTDLMCLMKTREAVKGLDHVKWILVAGGKTREDLTPPEYRLEDVLEQHDPKEAFANIDALDNAVLLYTSGTTGKPKGVILTHDNLIGCAEAAVDSGELHLWEEPRIMCSAMPMAHIFGVALMNSGYLTPEHLSESYMVQLAWFLPEPFMQKIQEHKANSIPAVPTILSLILNHPKVDEYDLSSLREVVCGAAPLPVELAEAFMRKYDCSVREIYGMTENAGIATANRASLGYKPGSAGKAYFNTEICIMDETDNILPAGEVGEVCTKGRATMKGYLNRPDATEETIRNGWLHTGDVGYLDEDGWLFIVDRKKDMIIRGGENIYPAELEDVIYTHPKVAEAAVVGVPDPIYGEMVIAYVVPKRGQELAGEEIIEFMQGKVTKFKVPGKVFLKEQLPKSGVGKILRRVLRDEAAEAVKQ